MPKVMPQASDGGRGRRGRRVSTTLSEINVIPLVDVMLVLLIIFMVAAPMLQRGIEVNLPVARQTQRMADERMYITIPVSYTSDRKVFMGEEAVSIDALAERIRQSMVGKEQRDVFLRGDGAVQYQQVLEVIDRLKEGGIEKVGMVALQKGR
ncbi:MAG TPA: ExbD/TolR family protein [Vicinamibacterales bacterium]|nr:ExbD/TolR family protein [Vicinamibacterales bacterium]